MKYVDDYRDSKLIASLLRRLRDLASRRWTLMEVCGGQTQSIVRYGLDELVSEQIELLHGPGCPVCVTPLHLLDAACELASDPNVLLCSFGDMLRVPGSSSNLAALKSAGAGIRVIYSPLDAVALAERFPTRQVVLFAIGFETTAPANATALLLAHQRKLTNFSLLSSMVLVPPAVAAIFDAPHNRVQALLGPGHVCSVVGSGDYERLSARYQVPIVITGFEPVDLLEGMLRSVALLETAQASVDIQYVRAVKAEGNPEARRAVERAFEVCDRTWRGIGVIPASGLRPAPAFAEFDAEKRFQLRVLQGAENPACISGQILTGAKKPTECPAFGAPCTPEQPLGATMVSQEGACAAYYHNQRKRSHAALVANRSGSRVSPLTSAPETAPRPAAPSSKERSL